MITSNYVPFKMRPTLELKENKNSKLLKNLGFNSSSSESGDQDQSEGASSRENISVGVLTR